ncbi:MAG: metallophosphoesterase [Pseudonocardiaceae bacterium]|nr:metallophosphoesterase [Pseudonocardiaceae bacterium]
MRVHVVSDVHGNVEALARACDGADALIVLGDLIDFVDYRDHSKGILGKLFGAERVAVFAKLRRERHHLETAAYARSLWESLDDAADAVENAIREQYEELFGAMTVPTYATPGNVDVPALWPDFTGGHIQALDGEVTEIGGLRFGFVGGALRPAGTAPRRTGVWRPYLRLEEDFDKGVAALDRVDVVCTHIPPDEPVLLYDVLARRPELGSASLARLINEQRPRWSLFGHVHQPLAPRARVGQTDCVNVGHFKQTEQPYVLRW